MLILSLFTVLFAVGLILFTGAADVVVALVFVCVVLLVVGGVGSRVSKMGSCNAKST